MNFNNFYFKLIDNADTKTLKLLKKKINKDNNSYCCNLPKNMLDNYKIICFINKKTNQIISFIWFSLYSGNEINLNDIDKIAFINFSYTFYEFRKLGLNTILRKWIEDFCLKNKINCIISVPLPKSNSENILIKMNFVKKNSYYVKKIF